MTLKEMAYRNKNGKMVRGSAAFQNFVFTKCGGVDGYNANVISEFLSEHPRLRAELHRETVTPISSFMKKLPFRKQA